MAHDRPDFPGNPRNDDRADYAALFRDSPHPQLIVDRDHVIVDATAGYLRLTRRDRDAVCGRDCCAAVAIPPEQASSIRQSIARVFATGEPDGPRPVQVEIEVTLVEGDGTIDAIWNLVHYPIRDVAGQVTFVAQVVEDIASLRATLGVVAGQPAGPPAQPDRSDESERLRLLRLFDQSLSFTVFMREPSHIVELANPAYLKMVGEVDLRDNAYGTAHRGEPPVPVRLLDAVYESGIPIIEHGLALRVPGSDGRMHTLYVDVVIQQIVDAAGKVLGVFMLGNDVTMAKATQDELSAYRTRLEEMVAERTRALERSENERRNAEAALHRAQRLEAVGKLTGGVAHDFNNVLQIIRGNLQLMQRRAPTDDPFAQRVDAALEGVDRGAKLASQLLAFGRRQPLEPIVVNLAEVVRRMDDMLHRALGESIDLVTRVAPGLWNAMVDVPRFENVILNVAINARDAMDHRGRLAMDLTNVVVDEAEASAHAGLDAGEWVMLAVADSGAGMSAEVQRRAFEPFFTTKPEGEGTGLGLSMVYGFMKQSGGHAALGSEEGRGTTVRLYLPRSHEKLGNAVRAPLDVPIRGDGETVLVVEDDEAVRLTVVDTLIELGYRVLRASDGQSALTILRSGVPIDLIFTDVIMPGPIASTEMVRQARALAPQVLVLFTSGFTRDAIVDHDRLRPGVSLLSKPYAREELARRLRQLFDVDRDASPPHHASTTSSAEEEQIVNTSPPGDGGSEPPGSRRVLLVEDSVEVRETTVEFINELGFDVVAVETAEAALEALATDRFDIVFTDVSLPGMSGIDLLKHVLEHDPLQRAVIASGYGADLGRHGFGAGVAVLAKPYDLATLEETLNRLLATGAGTNAARPGGEG